MIQSRIKIVNRLGLHARAAAKFAKCANKFSSEIKIIIGDQEADGKSVMSVMMLAAGKGTVLLLSVAGKDEEHASSALTKLVASCFDEKD